MSHQTTFVWYRYFPDAAEAQYVVDAVGREVFCHLTHTVYPPAVSITSHQIPVVCRESPVLPIRCKHIGRSTCLSVHVEILWFGPCFHAVGADADRNVSFQNNTFFPCVVSDLHQLDVQVVLNIIMIADFVFFLLDECLYLLCVIGTVSRPYGELRGSIFVTQIRECSIRL